MNFIPQLQRIRIMLGANSKEILFFLMIDDTKYKE